MPTRPPTPDLRAAIAAAMERLDLSQSELGRRAGVGPHKISEYLAGKSDPRASTIERLMRELGLRVN